MNVKIIRWINVCIEFPFARIPEFPDNYFPFANTSVVRELSCVWFYSIGILYVLMLYDGRLSYG